MISFTVSKREDSPGFEYLVGQALQATGSHIGQQYIQEQAPPDLVSRSGNGEHFKPGELVRTIHEATTFAAKSGLTEDSLLTLVQTEWRQQQQKQQQQQQQHRVKRLQRHHPHQQNTLKRRRVPQHNQILLQLQGQYHLDPQQPENQNQHQHQQPLAQQLYQHQLQEQQSYQQPLSYQQHFDQQQPYKRQLDHQQSESQNFQPYPQQQEQYFPPQKLHLNTEFQMPTNYRSDLSEEKPAPSVHCSPDSNDGCSPSWMTARVVTRWLCLDPEPAYQPVPSTTAYAYGGTTPMVDSGTSLVVSPSVPSTQPSSFGCDGGLMTQNAYLPNWTPMQPTRVTEVQPSMCKEEMLYPEAPPPTLEGTQAPPGFQPHGYYLPSPTVKLENAPESALHDDPPFIRQGDFGCLPVSLNPPQYFDGYDVEEESDDQISGPAASASLSTYTRPVAAKRGPFKDNEQRAKTALTRKMGSCIRCRMQRIRCVLDVNNANGPCVACRKLFENRANIYRPSCARLKITDMKIFKPGQVRGFEWTRRWKDSVVDEIDTWESVEVRMIEVTEGYTGKTIMLAVRKFRAQEGDKLHRTWVSTNGETKKVEVPPYAIVDMEAAAASIRQYIRSGLEPSFKTLLGSENELIYKTYALALARATEPSPFVTLAEKKLLLNTLDLWFSIRLSTKSFEIVGADLLDMPRNIINDQSSDLHGKVPIPPVLGAQLDSILLHQILARYRRFVLDDLSKMVHEKKPSTWLTTYLATFILLHNAALITRHDAAYARKHGMNRRFARPEEVKEYNIAAQTVLHYYHYCNKGIYPFTAECRDFELQTLAELDGNGIGLVHFTRRCATKQRRHWENLWAEDEYEDEYYYLSQLYEAGWKARSMA